MMKFIVIVMFIHIINANYCNMTLCKYEILTCDTICEKCTECLQCSNCTAHVWFDCCGCIGMCDNSYPMKII